jgi:MFS family permease
VSAPPAVSEGSRPSLITRPFVILAAAALAFYIAGGIILPITPRFVEERLSGDTLAVGIVFASFAIASLVLRPFVGWSSDRFGRRPLLIGGAVLTVAGMILHLVAVNVGVLVLARSLLGAGEGFFLVAALAAASDLAPPDRRGEALSFLSLSLYLGLAIGPLIGESVLGDGNFALVWIVTAGIAGVAVVLSLMTPETAPVAVADGKPRKRGPLIHPKGLFPGLIILTGMWGMAGFFAFLPGYAKSIGMTGVSVPLLVYALVVIGLRVVGARVPDRFGQVRVASAALALAAVGLAVIGAIPTIQALLVGTAIYAAGIAFIMPAIVSLAVSMVPPEERGAVVGTAAVFLDVAFGVAPVVLGVLAGSMGAGLTFLTSAAIAAVGCAALVARRKSLPRSTPD